MKPGARLGTSPMRGPSAVSDAIGVRKAVRIPLIHKGVSMSDQRRQVALRGAANIDSRCTGEVIKATNAVTKMRVFPRNGALRWTTPIVVAFTALAIGVFTVPDAPEVSSGSAVGSNAPVARPTMGVRSVPDAPEATGSHP